MTTAYSAQTGGHEVAADRLKDHPLVNGSATVGIMSGEAPRYPASVPATGHEQLLQHLQGMGLKAEATEGDYDGPEKSVIIYGPSRQQMHDLGKKFGQESVVYAQGGRPELLFTNGEKARKFHPEKVGAHKFYPLDKKPDNYWTLIPGHGYISLAFDGDRLLPAAVTDHPQDSLQKSCLQDLMGSGHLPAGGQYSSGAHPHAYPWHEQAHHSQHISAPGVLIIRSGGLQKAEYDSPETQKHPHFDAPPAVNDQAAGAGASTYHDFASKFGQVTPGVATNLKHYPLKGKEADVERLVADHGYTPYYAGGKHGRPDLAQRNYTTKHLMIYDPSAGSGGDFGEENYTRAWRQSHELAHALTYPEVNRIYGEGRRIGKLGTHRSLREAQRAVHWEWLAGHKQRQLLAGLGVTVPDETFNREMNTLMHDAAHRAVTGKFTEPSSEGFQPRQDLVPLETSLGLVNEAGQKMGLHGPEEILQKDEAGPESLGLESLREYEQVATETEQNVSIPEVRSRLAKTIRERITAYEDELLALRKKELEKSEEKACRQCGKKMNPVDAMVGSGSGPGVVCGPCTKKNHEKAVGKAEPLSKPSTSQAQNRAMHAAASGNSNIGIPKSVGKEFVSADEGKRVGSLPEHKKSEALTKSISGAVSAALAKTFGGGGNIANNATQGPGGMGVGGGDTAVGSNTMLRQSEHSNLEKDGAQQGMMLSEASHGHLDSWVKDFSDSTHPEDRRVLKSWERISKGAHHEGDVERFDKWMKKSADPENSGDRKAKEQWQGLRGRIAKAEFAKSVLHKADAMSGADANYAASESSCGPCNVDNLREEGGTREVKPVDPLSTKKAESVEERVGPKAGVTDAQKNASSSGLVAPKSVHGRVGTESGSGSAAAPRGNAPSAKGPSSKSNAPNVTGTISKPGTTTPKNIVSQGMATAKTAGPAGKNVVKAEPPMAKPPSGKSPTAVPTSQPMQKGALSSIAQGAVTGAASGMLGAHAHSPGNPQAGAMGGVVGALHGALQTAIGVRRQKSGGLLAGGSGMQKAEFARDVLAKASMGTPGGDALQGAHNAAKMPAAPAPKMPSPGEHAQRAEGLNSFMPAGKFSAGAGAGAAPTAKPMTAPGLGAAKPMTPKPAGMPSGAGVSKPLGAPGGGANAGIMGKLRGGLSKPKAPGVV